MKTNKTIGLEGAALRQRGVTLLEVLIAVLVLSFGLLGMAGLQASAARNNQSSFERTVAIIESNAIIDVMRAARDKTFSTSCSGGISYECTQTAAWLQRLKDNLGATATGEISCASNLCVITVTWQDTRGTAQLKNADALGSKHTTTFVTEARI